MVHLPQGEISLFTHLLHLCLLATKLVCVWFTEYCERYAKPEDAGAVPEEKSSDDELSEAEYASSDEEIAGKADP